MSAFTARHCFPGWWPDRNRIWTNEWWRLLGCWRNRLPNRWYWKCISVKSNLCNYLRMCQLFLDFSDQSVKHVNSSVCVQWSFRPWASSRLQINLIDNQQTWYRLACYGLVRMENPNENKLYKKKIGSLMSYKWLREWSMCNANLDEWQPSCCIDPCIKLYNSPLRPGAYCWDVVNC